MRDNPVRVENIGDSRSGVVGFIWKSEMFNMFKKRNGYRKLAGVAMLVLLMSGSERACALANLQLLDVSSGYSGCSWIDNGNGTSTITVDIDYKPAASGIPSGTKLVSRAILLYGYNKDGVLKQSADLADAIYLNGDGGANVAIYYGRGYSIYLKRYEPFADWSNSGSFVAHYVMEVTNSNFSEWPAISIRAGNFTYGDDAGEMSGVAYIKFGEKDGICEKVTYPEIPPPSDIKIDMTAPDWSLGELPRGDSEQTFPEVANQLCFMYSGPSVNGKRFIVHASNANGVVGNRYRLKNMSDASQYIPYGIVLSGSRVFSLPNVTNVALAMSDSGKTCFMPTFKTTVDNTVKEGDYSDVLTFTVVTEP